MGIESFGMGMTKSPGAGSKAVWERSPQRLAIYYQIMHF